jgi:hypothetical protein
LWYLPRLTTKVVGPIAWDGLLARGDSVL